MILLYYAMWRTDQFKKHHEEEYLFHYSLLEILERLRLSDPSDYLNTRGWLLRWYFNYANASNKRLLQMQFGPL